MKSALMVAIIAAAVSCSDGGAKFAGPFNVVMKQPVQCEDEGTGDVRFVNSSVRKKSKNLYTLTSTVLLKVPFDDILSLTVNFAVWGNGGWRPNFLIMEYKNACTSFSRVLPGLFQQVLANNTLSGCPVPAGNYTLIDADASPKVDIQSLPYNKYRAYLFFDAKDGTNLGCLGMIIEIVPKSRKG